MQLLECAAKMQCDTAHVLDDILAKAAGVPAVSDIIFDHNDETDSLTVVAKARRECHRLDFDGEISWTDLLHCLLHRDAPDYSKKEYEDFACFRLSSGRELRFRASVSRGLHGSSLVLRVFSDEIPTPEKLLLPPRTVDLITSIPDGLVLVLGGTGHGKTTSMVSLVRKRCELLSQNVITIEDPVEYILGDVGRSRVVQRQVGMHTESFASGLRSAMRMAPDVIMIGEIRDSESAAIALSAGMSGHLVIGTMHSDFVAQGIQRLYSYVNRDGSGMEGPIGLEIIAATLRCAFAQRLLRHDEKQELVPIHEVLVSTTGVASKIRAMQFNTLGTDIETGRNKGMQNFATSLAERISRGVLPSRTRHAALME